MIDYQVIKLDVYRPALNSDILDSKIRACFANLSRWPVFSYTLTRFIRYWPVHSETILSS